MCLLFKHLVKLESYYFEQFNLTQMSKIQYNMKFNMIDCVCSIDYL